MTLLLDSGNHGEVVIPSGWKLSYIRFCINNNTLKLQGFDYSIRRMNEASSTTGWNEDIETVLCASPDVYLDPIDLRDDEFITEILVFVGMSKIRAIAIRTNFEDYGLFGDEGQSNRIVYGTEGLGLARITYSGNPHSLFSLQFDFKEC